MGGCHQSARNPASECHRLGGGQRQIPFGPRGAPIRMERSVRGFVAKTGMHNLTKDTSTLGTWGMVPRGSVRRTVGNVEITQKRRESFVQFPVWTEQKLVCLLHCSLLSSKALTPGTAVRHRPVPINFRPRSKSSSSLSS